MGGTTGDGVPASGVPASGVPASGVPASGVPASGVPASGVPASGVRASDATVERLSAATGDGRLTLDEFSQRMDRATSARTRAELDRLVADLPGDAGAAGTTVADHAQAGPSWHVAPIGGLTVSGPWRMDRHVIVISIVGGTRLDLSQAELAAPEVTLTKVSLVGGVRVEVPAGIRVDVSGLSLIGGTRVEGGPEPGPGAPTVHIRAFSLVGGVRVRRSGLARRSRADQRCDRRSRRDSVHALIRSSCGRVPVQGRRAAWAAGRGEPVRSRCRAAASTAHAAAA
jgi:hypothetical protein